MMMRDVPLLSKVVVKVKRNGSDISEEVGTTIAQVGNEVYCKLDTNENDHFFIPVRCEFISYEMDGKTYYRMEYQPNALLF